VALFNKCTIPSVSKISDVLGFCTWIKEEERDRECTGSEEG